MLDNYLSEDHNIQLEEGFNWKVYYTQHLLSTWVSGAILSVFAYFNSFIILTQKAQTQKPKHKNLPKITKAEGSHAGLVPEPPEPAVHEATSFSAS